MLILEKKYDEYKKIDEELLKEKSEIQQKLQMLEVMKGEVMNREMATINLKKERRDQEVWQKKYKEIMNVLQQNVIKKYSNESSLNQNIKLKHPELINQI